MVELCGKDKIVIQAGVFGEEFSPYPKEFMAMCREEGVSAFFLYVSPRVTQSEEWREFVQALP